MSEGSPSNRLPRTVNPRKLAYSQVELQGLVACEALQRLSEAVIATRDVTAILRFYIGDDGKLLVKGSVEAKLVYECQRCLQAMPETTVTADIYVGVVRDEDGAKGLPRSLDPWVVSDDEADLFALIEDELLLALPVVSYHESPCVDQSLLSTGEVVEETTSEKQNPFSVLSSLKEKE